MNYDLKKNNRIITKQKKVKKTTLPSVCEAWLIYTEISFDVMSHCIEGRLNV